jgi:hypothetical protein
MCSSCQADWFKAPSAAGSKTITCERCLAEATCAANVTLATLRVNYGYWRMGERSKDVHLCPQVDGWSPCLGGNSSGRSEEYESVIGPLPGDGYCRDGYGGPLCTVCTNESMHFNQDTAECRECPTAGDLSAVGGFVVGFLALACAGVRVALCLTRGSERRGEIELCARRLAMRISALGLVPKLKLLIAFFQSVFAIPSVYNVRLPPYYYRWSTSRGTRTLVCAAASPRAAFASLLRQCASSTSSPSIGSTSSCLGSASLADTTRGS